MTGKRSIDAGDAVLHCNNGIGNREREILMGVDTDFGALVEDVAVCTNTIRDVVHHQTSTRVGDVDAVRAIRFHQLGLLGQFLGRRHVAHHQEARDVHADLAGGFDVLRGDVGSVQCVATRTERTPRS